MPATLESRTEHLFFKFPQPLHALDVYHWLQELTTEQQLWIEERKMELIDKGQHRDRQYMHAGAIDFADVAEPLLFTFEYDKKPELATLLRGFGGRIGPVTGLGIQRNTWRKEQLLSTMELPENADEEKVALPPVTFEEFPGVYRMIITRMQESLDLYIAKAVIPV